MRLGIPSGHIQQSVLDMINLVLSMEYLPPISRQDRIRGYIDIPEESTRNVLDSLKATGLVA